MPVHQTGQLPALGEEFGTTRIGWNGVGDIRSKEVPRVVITVAVIPLTVEGIIGNSSAVFADLIQRVRPGVPERGSQPAKRAHLKGSLQCVVVGGTDAVELKNRAKVRKRKYGSRCVVRLVDVGHYVQLAPLVTHISKLKHRRLPEAFLDLEAVGGEVWGAEILVDREQVKPRSSRA